MNKRSQKEYEEEEEEAIRRIFEQVHIGYIY
jgi:hypothetical protein